MIWQLALALRARGHEPRIVVPRTSPSLPAVSQVDGVRIDRYEDRIHSFATLYLTSVRAARRAIGTIVAEWRPGVVHAHHGISGLAASRVPARPLCYSFYGPWHLEFLHELTARRDARALKRWTRPLWAPPKAALARAIERAAVRRSDRAVVLSRYSERQLASVHGLSAERVVLIPGGVDLARFRPAAPGESARGALGLPARGPLLVTVRRLVPRMGLDMLLEALVLLPDAHLVIVGAGWLRGELEARARRLGVSGRVTFAGFVPDADLPRYYQAADVVVLPSVALEGFGLITLEALACGTPVVATPDSGAVDVVQPLEAKWLADAVTAPALARAVERALQTLAVERDLPGRCRAHAERYAWDRIAERYETLYASLGAR